MKLAVVFLAVALLAAAPAARANDDWKKPDFCGKSDCPPFEVEAPKRITRRRKYEGGLWAVTNVSDTKYEVRKASSSLLPTLRMSSPLNNCNVIAAALAVQLAYTKAAAKLLRYFNGANDAKERLERTTPTVAALKLSKDSQESERNYTFSMWLPTNYQKEEEEDVPEPNDEAVYIVDFPEATGFVRTFGGFATEDTILQEATALHEALTKDGEDFEEDIVFVAVYDPAVKLLNRHNEVLC